MYTYSTPPFVTVNLLGAHNLNWWTVPPVALFIDTESAGLSKKDKPLVNTDKRPSALALRKTQTAFIKYCTILEAPAGQIKFLMCWLALFGHARGEYVCN